MATTYCKGPCGSKGQVLVIDLSWCLFLFATRQGEVTYNSHHVDQCYYDYYCRRVALRLVFPHSLEALARLPLVVVKPSSSMSTRSAASVSQSVCLSACRHAGEPTNQPTDPHGRGAPQLMMAVGRYLLVVGDPWVRVPIIPIKGVRRHDSTYPSVRATVSRRPPIYNYNGPTDRMIAKPKLGIYRYVAT